MRLLMTSIAAMTASATLLGLLFVYALYAPTVPAPSPALTSHPALAWTGNGGPRVLETAPNSTN